MKKIRIGIETRLLAGQMTGIGNYSFLLLKALIDACPELEYAASAASAGRVSMLPQSAPLNEIRTRARPRSIPVRSRALLFPSLYEGFGMPVVEAMSCGAHVIHSAGSSMDEISGDAGIRLPATDIAAWTDAMRHAIEPPDAQTAAAARRRRIAQALRFDWAASAAQVRAAYASLLGE